MRGGWLVVCGVVLASSRVHADAGAEAQALFDQGLKEMAAHDYDHACRDFAVSLEKVDDSATRFQLADCNLQRGKIALAWRLLREVADAHSLAQDLRDDAAKRAAAIEPRLPRYQLHVAGEPPPGLAIAINGDAADPKLDAALPIDPGPLRVVAQAPGYETWTHSFEASEGKTTTIDVPALVKLPDKPHVGTVRVESRPDAEITIDHARVATGSYDATLAVGPHTLHVSAPGMLPYDVQLDVRDQDVRTIDVPLVPLFAAGETGPSFVLGFDIAGGQRGVGDDPAAIAYHLDADLRLGARVDLGLFIEYGSVRATGTCGLVNLNGPAATSEFDFGTRNQFTRCMYVMPGIQLAVHVRPRASLDPYVMASPGFRFQFDDWTPIDATGRALAKQSGLFPGLLLTTRVGLDYHPMMAEHAGWSIGAYVSAVVTALGEETVDNKDTPISSMYSQSDNRSYVSWFGGVRSAVAF